jgi:hypothetical protein
MEVFSLPQIHVVERRESVSLEVIRILSTSAAVEGITDQSRVRVLLHQRQTFPDKPVCNGITVRMIIDDQYRVTEHRYHFAHVLSAFLISTPRSQPSEYTGISVVQARKNPQPMMD